MAHLALFYIVLVSFFALHECSDIGESGNVGGDLEPIRIASKPVSPMRPIPVNDNGNVVTGSGPIKPDSIRVAPRPVFPGPNDLRVAAFSPPDDDDVVTISEPIKPGSVRVASRPVFSRPNDLSISAFSSPHVVIPITSRPVFTGPNDLSVAAFSPPDVVP